MTRNKITNVGYVGTKMSWLVNAKSCLYIYIYIGGGGARGVMVIVVGNGHGNTSSNPGRD